jgi:hypothetical protein
MKQRCYLISSSETNSKNVWNPQYLRKNAMRVEDESLICKKLTLKIATLIILAVIAYFLYQVFTITAGYEASIERIITEKG